MALLVSSAPVLAAEPNADESDCQEQTGGKIIPGFVKKKANILVKCEKGERSAKNPAADCEPPYGGNTATKIGQEQAKAVSKITSKCPDCPECYDGAGNCATFAGTNVAGIEGVVDGFKAIVYCDDTGSTDGLNAVEAKCQDQIAKNLAKYVKKIAKCAAKCIDTDRDADGTTSAACAPPPTDPTLIDCRTKASGKATTKIDDKCGAAAGDNFPECDVAMSGAAWAALAGSATDANYPTYYCQDP